MPIIDALIVSGITLAFIIFGVVLAWGEFQTRHLPGLTGPDVRGSAKRRRPVLVVPANAPRRKEATSVD